MKNTLRRSRHNAAILPLLTQKRGKEKRREEKGREGKRREEKRNEEKGDMGMKGKGREENIANDKKLEEKEELIFMICTENTHEDII